MALSTSTKYIWLRLDHRAPCMNHPKVENLVMYVQSRVDAQALLSNIEDVMTFAHHLQNQQELELQ